MVRPISADSLAKLSEQYGAEPVTIVDIQWTDGGSIYSYSDKRIDNNVRADIVDVSELDAVVQVTNNADSAQISVTLDDSRDEIRQIMNGNDVHKRPCWVYQWFDELNISDKILVFKGQISSPIEWNEGDRTVSFDVVTRIEDVEVGFSVEEGLFPVIPTELIGKPWPLAFGTVVNVPALQVRSGVRGFLKNGFGIVDPTLQPRIEQVQKICCPRVKLRERVPLSGGLIDTGGEIESIYGPDPNCECRKLAIKTELELNRDAQVEHEPATIEITNGRFFPQNKRITLQVDDAQIIGSFNGDTFTVEDLTHPAETTLTIPPIKSWSCDNEESTDPPEGSQKSGCVLDNSKAEPSTVTEEAWQYYNGFPSSSFFWAESGSEVYYTSNSEIVYACNLVSSDVITVKAWRTFDSGARRLTVVPEDYYTVRETDFNGYTVTEIVMDRKLSLRGEGWEDDIYVTMDSTVGPNTIDILEWFINRYTSYGIDTTSFNDVKSRLANYPMHFALLERKNIFTLLREIAFQARCAIYLRDDTFYVKYLPHEPNAADTITEDDAEARSLILGHTETEDLATKIVATFTDDYSLAEPFKMIATHNTGKYGVKTREFDFYCYSQTHLVQKSVVFWLIRLSQTWRKVKFETDLSKIALEVFDTVSLNLPDFSPSTISGCVLEESRYNSETQSIHFTAWTPVLAGSQEKYDAAFPADISVAVDLTEQPGGGGQPNVDVTAPYGHVLNPDNTSSGGDGTGLDGFGQNPCATKDTFFKPPSNYRPDYVRYVWGRCVVSSITWPGKYSPDSGEESPGSPYAPDRVKPSVEPPSRYSVPGGSSFNLDGCDCNLSEREALKEALSRDTAGSMQDVLDNLPGQDELIEDGIYCWAVVALEFFKPTSVQQPGGGGPCQADPGDCGSGPCIDNLVARERVYFNSIEEAQKFLEQMKASIPDQVCVGQTYLKSANIGHPYWGLNSCQEPETPEIIGYERTGDPQMLDWVASLES